MRKKLILVSLVLFLIFLVWKTSNLFFSKSHSKLSEKEETEKQELFAKTSSENGYEEFVLVTMPKTGTHLIRPILENLTGKDSISYWSPDVFLSKNYLYDKNMTSLLLMLPGVMQAYWLHQPIPTDNFNSVLDDLFYKNSFFVTHAPYSEEMENLLKERNAVVFFLYRDPRDWVISVINHPPISGVDLYGGPIGDKYFTTLNKDQKVNFIVRGTQQYYSAYEAFSKFLPWMNSSVCCPIRFEALLGPKGGRYSEEAQLAELRKIAKALNLNTSDEALLDAANSSYGKGIVFSKGKAGTWKEHFNEKNKNLFKKDFADILIDLGYEKNYTW